MFDHISGLILVTPELVLVRPGETDRAVSQNTVKRVSHLGKLKIAKRSEVFDAPHQSRSAGATRISMWSACVQATGKQAVWMHSLSTAPADKLLIVFNLAYLRTYLQPIERLLIHRIIILFNGLGCASFHTFHLAYYYNYLYINKRLKGLYI